MFAIVNSLLDWMASTTTKERNAFSHSSHRGHMLDIQVSAGLVSSEASFLGLPTSRRLLTWSFLCVHGGMRPDLLFLGGQRSC